MNLTYPWRLMEMDCLTYGREIQAIQEKNVNEKVKYKSEDDFKYRYQKGDVLEPVVNLMLYWGKKKWTAPWTLKGMMGDFGSLPAKMHPLIGNYRVVMISMRAIPDEDLQKMKSDLKYVLGILKCTASRKRYESYIHENREFFSRISKSAVDVIDVFTNIKKVRDNIQYVQNQEIGEEETDLCKALDDMMKHEMKKGVKQGVKQGMKKGMKQGVKQGERLGTLKILYALVNDGLLKLEEAARRAGMSEETFGKEMKKAGYH